LNKEATSMNGNQLEKVLSQTQEALEALKRRSKNEVDILETY
jgi:hypothetical protein